MQYLTFVTTCRGRLEHLKQSLPTFVNQPGTNVVVVDYDCPQGTAAWVRANHPAATVVTAGKQRVFQAARARNMGAAITRTPWLCFVDADALLAPDFSATVRPLLKRGHYYRPHPRAADAAGFCIVHRDDFVRLEGYDAAIHGYGMEDYDLYARLQDIGVPIGGIPGELLTMIAHDDEMRTRHFDIKNTSIPINEIYCAVKWDLTRVRGGLNLPLADRVQLHASVTKTVNEAVRQGKEVVFTVPIAQRNALGMGRLNIGLSYRTQFALGKGPKVPGRTQPAPARKDDWP